MEEEKVNIMTREIIRVPTGVLGMDTMIEGGIPKGFTIVLTGGPGCGKSIFAMEFLYKGVVKYGETGIYVSLQENVEEMKMNFSRFGWDLDKIDIIELIPEKVEFLDEKDYIVPGELGEGRENVDFKRFSMKSVKELLGERVKSKGATRMVIDSLAPLMFHAENSLAIRQEILDITVFLKKLGCTSLVITEMPEGGKGVSRFGVEEFMAQGIIVLYNTIKGSERVRGLEVLKMRGTDHSKKICLMEIGQKGITVYPNEDLHRSF